MLELRSVKIDSPGISRSIKTTLYSLLRMGPPRLLCRSASRIKFNASRPLFATAVGQHRCPPWYISTHHHK